MLSTRGGPPQSTHGKKKPAEVVGGFSFGLAPKPYEQPLVEPQVSHFRQVPLRTRVKLPQSPQASPT